MLDDLVRFMADEVAMDGSLGCSPRRFTYLVSSEISPIHKRPAAAPPLNPDQLEKTAAYVWRQVVELAGYRVVDRKTVKRLLNETSDLSMKPYRETKDKKPKSTKKELEAAESFSAVNPSRMSGLNEKPREALAGSVFAESEIGDEVDKRDMIKLKEAYGENVCVVAEPATIRMALTGTRVPNPKFSVVVCAVIEMVSRARAAGVTMVDIANRATQATGRTGKLAAQNAFYVVKVLVEAGLVVKLKGMDENRTSSSIIHTKYLERNRSYTARLEYLQIRSGNTDDGPHEVQPPAMEKLGSTILSIDKSTKLPVFPPFGTAELKNKWFMRSRLVALLRSDLWHHLIENRDLLVALGFEGTIRKADRRLFQRYILGFIGEGLLERVVVPSTFNTKPHSCIRLTEFRPKEEETFEGEQLPEASMVKAKLGESSDEEDEDEAEEFAMDSLASVRSQLYIPFDHTLTKEHVIIETIRSSGSEGINFEQIYERLKFDHKLIQGVCNKFASIGLVFPHLSHYGLFDTTERDLRHTQLRWFTTRGYITYCQHINVEPLVGSEYIRALDKAGQFRDLTGRTFYTSTDAYLAKLRGTLSGTYIKRTNVKNIPGKEDVPYFRGRPRKFVKIVDFNRTLLKRSKGIVLHTSPAIPNLLLYNKATKMFFVVPREHVEGKQPIPEPADWNDPTGGATGKTQAYWIALAGGEEPPPNPTQEDLLAEKVKVVKAIKKRGRPRKVVEPTPEALTDAQSVTPDPAVNSEADEPPKKKARAVKPRAVKSRAAKPQPAPRATRSRAMNKAEAASVQSMGNASSYPVQHTTEDVLPLEISSQQRLAEDHLPQSARAQSMEVTQDRPHVTASLPEVFSETVSTGDDIMERKIDPMLRELSVAPVSMPFNAASPVATEIPGELVIPADPTNASAPSRPKPARTGPSDPNTERPKKRARIDHNLEMQLREVLRYIDEQGGIVQGKYALAMGLGDWTTKAATASGQASDQAIRGKIDGRRLTNMIDVLETSGRICRTTVVCHNSHSTDKTFQVIWLPDQPEEQVDEYIKELSRSGIQRVRPAPALQEAVPADALGFSRATRAPRPPAHLRYDQVSSLLIANATPEQLHGLDPEESRNAFRQDWRLYPQQYGWEPGVARRLELLHRLLCDAGRAHGQAVDNGICVRRNDFLRQLSVSTTCKLMPIKDSNEELFAIVKSGEAARTTIGQLTGGLADLLSVTAPRMRTKFENILKHLVTMGLAQPREKVLGEHDVFLPTTLERSNFIWLAQSGSIIDWTKAKKDKAKGIPSSITCWNIPLQSAEDVNTFWYLTWYRTTPGDAEDVKASHVVQILTEAGRPHEQSESIFNHTDSLANQLSVARAWRKGFVLQDTQQRYLQWLVENDHVPENLQDHPEYPQEIAHRIFAPLQPTRRYLQSRVSRHRLHQQREAKKAEERQADEALRESIRKKIEERQIAREASWVELLDKACIRVGIGSSEELVKYLGAFHRRYLRDPVSFNTTQFFDVVSNYVSGLKQLKKPTTRSTLVSSVTPVVKTSRVRLHWTRQMEELARDAFVVIEHRRKHVPDDAVNKATIASAWGKVFPHVQPYKVRRKVTDWMAESAANAEFMKQLTLQWEHIQVNLHSDDLIDPDPSSLEHFEVLANIDLLRLNVKKNALLQRARDPEEGDAEFLHALPRSLEVLNAMFVQDETSAVRVDNGFQAYWLGRTSEMSKERDVVAQSALLSMGKSGIRISPNKEDVKLEAAAKTIISTPSAGYREDQADILLQNFTTRKADFKYRRMLKEQVFTRADKSVTTGRGFRFAEPYVALRETPLAPTIFEDCLGAKDIQLGEYVEWNPICQPGEVAGFLELVSDGKISIALETQTVSEILEGWAQSYGASRKIDDEDIELDFAFRKTDQVVPQILAENDSDLCAAPIEIESMDIDKTSATMDPDAKTMLALVEEAGDDGMAIEDLLAQCKTSESPSDAMVLAMKLVQMGKVSCLGWSHARLVHADHLSAWKSVFGSRKAPVPMIEDGLIKPKRAEDKDHAVKLPYQWLDIYGELNEDELRVAMNGMMAHIYMRPGVNESVLRSVVSKLFSRLEFNFLIQSLLDRGQIRRFCGDANISPRLALPVVGLATIEDEKFISYMSDGIMKHI